MKTRKADPKQTINDFTASSSIKAVGFFFPLYVFHKNTLMRHQTVYLFFFADFYFAPMYLFIFFFLVVIIWYICFRNYKGVKRHHICLPVIVTSCFPEPSRYSLWNIKGKGIRRNKNRIYKFVIQRIKQSLVLVSFFTAVKLGTSCKLTFIIHNLNEQNSRLNFHYF